MLNPQASSCEIAVQCTSAGAVFRLPLAQAQVEAGQEATKEKRALRRAAGNGTKDVEM